MGTRGRKSSAELAIVGPSGVVTVNRPNAPSELGDEQAVEWRQVVNAHAADRFPREQHAMLGAHCRHVVAMRRIGQLIAAAEAAEPFDVAEYDRLLKMQERESRCLASLAVRLGFAYSTAYEKRPAKGGTTAKAPWESEPDAG
jgi:hypothetical protein